MTPFEARYKKQFSGLGLTGKADVSAEQKIAQLVNDTWSYSWHWPDEIDTKWKEAVQADIDTRRKQLIDELNGIEQAQRILSTIEVGFQESLDE